MKEGVFLDQTLNIMISLILLAYPIFSIPSIVRSKQESGKYFSESRFFYPKACWVGNWDQYAQ